MRLWLLRPKQEQFEHLSYTERRQTDPWEPWYDKAFGFVVRADDENQARAFADAEAGDENYDPKAGHPWLDPALSTCEPLADAGEPGTVLRDYRSA